MRSGRGAAASRRALAVLVPALVLAALSGCAALGHESPAEIVVDFTPGATPADIARVRTACADLPGISVQPRGRANAVNRRYPLRFDVTGASVAQRSRLYACLDKDPAVRGATEQDT